MQNIALISQQKQNRLKHAYRIQLINDPNTQAYIRYISRSHKLKSKLARVWYTCS
jgi:hypothetical protein